MNKTFDVPDFLRNQHNLQDEVVSMNKPKEVHSIKRMTREDALIDNRNKYVTNDLAFQKVVSMLRTSELENSDSAYIESIFRDDFIIR